MKRADYIRRFLQSEEMRDAFPDPIERRTIAEKAWDAAGGIPDIYDTVHEACCTLHKQDVPEVEAAISILAPILREWWERLLTDATLAAERQLAELEDDLPTNAVDALTEAEDDEGSIIAAFLLALTVGARAPFDSDLQRAVERGVSGLLRDGASSVGLSLDLARDPLLRPGALQDLRLAMAGRVLTRTDELEDIARDFLTNRRARTPRSARQAALDPQTPGRARSLAEWRQGLREAAGLADTAWIRTVTDVWAYRWYSVAQFRAGRQQGFTVFRAVAVDDSRTTPFCRWVNGRIISVQRAERQIQRHIQAAMDGDVEAQMANWPLLPSSLVGSERRRPEFARAFARVGLPPYHFGCRTTVGVSVV